MCKLETWSLNQRRKELVQLLRAAPLLKSRHVTVGHGVFQATLPPSFCQQLLLRRPVLGTCSASPPDCRKEMSDLPSTNTPSMQHVLHARSTQSAKARQAERACVLQACVHAVAQHGSILCHLLIANPELLETSMGTAKSFAKCRTENSASSRSQACTQAPSWSL